MGYLFAIILSLFFTFYVVLKNYQSKYQKNIVCSWG